MTEVNEIVAIFEVNKNVFAAIGVLMSVGGAVTSFDPRCQPNNSVQLTSTGKRALELFEESIKMSIESGSTLVYSGPKNRG